MKKLLSSLVVLLLLISCCLIAAFPTSASDINYDDFDIIDGIVLEYLGEGVEDIVIPSVDVNGDPITQIAERAFLGNTEITSVVIPEGIEFIGHEAFQNCSSLNEVTLPYSLQETGISCFRRAPLHNLTVPGNLTVINHDFAWVSFDLVLSPGVVELKTGCFYGGFTDLVLPESVEMVRACFHGGLSKQIKEKNIYVLNPDCELGVVEPKYAAITATMFASENSYNAEIISDEIQPLTFCYEGNTCRFTIYGLEGSATEEYVDTYMKGKMGSSGVVVKFEALTQAELDSLEEENKGKGIKRPSITGTDGGTDGAGDGATDGDGAATGNDTDGAQTNNNNNNTNNGGSNNVNGGGIDSTLLIIVIAAFGGFFLLIIIAVIVVVIVMNNKKKKKKAKRKAKKAAEAALEAVTESVAEDVAEDVVEEAGEEE